MFDQIDDFLNMQLAQLREHAPVTFSPFGAILATIAITYGCKAIAVMLRFLTGHGYSNVAPRDVKFKPFSAASRAMGAHQNGFEALQLITAAVLMALQAKVSSTALAELMTLFVYSRLVYSLVYVFVSFNEVFSYIRSAAWFVGFACTLKIMVMAALANGKIYYMK